MSHWNGIEPRWFSAFTPAPFVDEQLYISQTSLPSAIGAPVTEFGHARPIAVSHLRCAAREIASTLCRAPGSGRSPVALRYHDPVASAPVPDGHAHGPGPASAQ